METKCTSCGFRFSGSPGEVWQRESDYLEDHPKLPKVYFLRKVVASSSPLLPRVAVESLACYQDGKFFEAKWLRS